MLSRMNRTRTYAGRWLYMYQFQLSHAFTEQHSGSSMVDVIWYQVSEARWKESLWRWRMRGSCMHNRSYVVHCSRFRSPPHKNLAWDQDLPRDWRAQHETTAAVCSEEQQLRDTYQKQLQVVSRMPCMTKRLNEWEQATQYRSTTKTTSIQAKSQWSWAI